VVSGLTENGALCKFRMYTGCLVLSLGTCDRLVPECKTQTYTPDFRKTHPDIGRKKEDLFGETWMSGNPKPKPPNYDPNTNTNPNPNDKVTDICGWVCDLVVSSWG